MALVVLPRIFMVDANGVPRLGAKLYVFDAQTTTPRVTYTTPALDIEHAHPVVALTAGLFPSVWIDELGGDYKLVIRSAEDDGSGTPLVNEDNLPARDFLPINARTYGTTWDAIQTAIDIAADAGGGIVYMPGQYTHDDADTIHMRSNVRLTGDGYTSEILVPAGANWSDNVLKFEAITKASADNIRINGNRASTGGGTRYGFYFGGADQCSLTNVYAHACEGDGIHLYDSDGCIVSQCQSFDNLYHGIELEQSRDCVASSNHCYSNLRHGIYVFEGEVGASGSKGLTVSANSCHNNTQYGIAAQGPLTEDITIQGNSVRSNGQYGITIFDRVTGAAVTGNIVALNGYTGIYLYRCQKSAIVGNVLHNNSQDEDGAYHEIHLDSEVADTGTSRSRYNVITGNVIRMEGVIRADYGIKENGVDDGPNIVQGNYVAGPGRSGDIAVLQETGANSSMALCRGNIGRVSENRGFATFDGDGVETEFVIPHELTPDEPRGVNVTAGSPDAAGDFSVASDATNITVTFVIAPDAGTDNVILRWSATT